MNIDKAIKEQQDALADKWCPWSPELKQAITLGIEALELVKHYRVAHPSKCADSLPGENKH